VTQTPNCDHSDNDSTTRYSLLCLKKTSKL